MARRIFQFKRGKANTQLNSAAEAAEFPRARRLQEQSAAKLENAAMTIAVNRK